MRRKAPVRCGMGEKAEVILSPELYLSSFISGEELNKYFGKDKTPQQMKEQIIKLLDDWSGKQKELAPPVKKTEKEK